MDGILIVNKPQGMTSHDVVDFMRRLLGIKKIGHAGTLDPMATGVLVMLIGKATKLSDKLSAKDKEYEASLTLGLRSDTADIWGKLSPSDVLIDYSDPDIRFAFSHFLGEIDQLPPDYSAKKINGIRMYKLARKGISVEAKPSRIHIRELRIESIELPRIRFSILCSKGTYVRKICSDIGEALGCGAVMSELRRIRSGDFAIDGATSPDELKKISRDELLKRFIRYEDI